MKWPGRLAKLLDEPPAPEANSLQKFASVQDSIQNYFSQERHLVGRQTYKLRRSAALAEWQKLMA